MIRPKHQHFIPKSYLKNFAINQDGKQFVQAKLKNEDVPKEKLISIKDICVNKNLYTIPDREGDEKYALENYYAREVDDLYPEVYGWLTDPNLTKISVEQRAKIIMTTMSLFFRTPKFLNENQRIIYKLLDYSVRNFQDKEGNIKFNFRDIKLNFNIKDIDEVRKELKIKNKVRFLHDHLKDWHDFVKFKTLAAICVYRIKDDMQLITGDNPVYMHSVTGNPFDLFDPTNIISLTLDNKHYLTIMPNTEEAMLDSIYRADRDKWFVLTTNLQIEKECEDWIIGTPDSITAHLADQLKYNEETPENLQALADMKKRAEDGLQLYSIIEENGVLHRKVAEKVKSMLQYKIHQEDPELHEIANALKEHGFLKE